MDYKQKYLKYKEKYIKLKKQIGGELTFTERNVKIKLDLIVGKYKILLKFLNDNKLSDEIIKLNNDLGIDGIIEQECKIENKIMISITKHLTENGKKDDICLYSLAYSLLNKKIDIFDRYIFDISEEHDNINNLKIITGYKVNSVTLKPEFTIVSNTNTSSNKLVSTISLKQSDKLKLSDKSKPHKITDCVDNKGIGLNVAYYAGPSTNNKLQKGYINSKTKHISIIYPELFSKGLMFERDITNIDDVFMDNTCIPLFKI